MEQNGTDIKDILQASPKEKAIAYCIHFADPEGGQEYTNKEAASILESLTQKDKKEFFKWTRLYVVFAQTAPELANSLHEYTISIRKVENMLDTIHAKELEIAHLSYIRASLPSEARHALDLNVALIFNTDEVDPQTCKEVSLSVDPDSTTPYALTITPEFMERLQNEITTLAYYGCRYTTFCKALIKWMNQKKASAILPPVYRHDLLANYLNKKHGSATMEYYSASGIKKDNKEGQPVSRPRTQVSEILPEFKDMMPDDEEVETILTHLNVRLDETGKEK